MTKSKILYTSFLNSIIFFIMKTHCHDLNKLKYSMHQKAYDKFWMHRTFWHGHLSLRFVDDINRNVQTAWINSRRNFPSFYQRTNNAYNYIRMNRILKNTKLILKYMTIPQNPFQTDEYENISLICKILNMFNDSNTCSRTKIFKYM